MLVIRPEQMEALNAGCLEQYRQRVVERLHREYSDPDAQASDEELHDFVCRGMEQAGSYGIDGEDDMEAFIVFLFVHGERFDDDPDFAWARSILDDDEIDGTAKMEAIEEREALMERRESS